MAIEIDTKLGKIDITSDVIATIAGGAAEENFGIVGMASRHQIRDGLTDILRRENYTKGVIVDKKKKVYILTCISLLALELKYPKLHITFKNASNTH